MAALRRASRLRHCATLKEALEIKRQLKEASFLFVPAAQPAGSRPIQLLWDLFLAVSAGGAISALSGGKPIVGRSLEESLRLLVKPQRLLKNLVLLYSDVERLVWLGAWMPRYPMQT